MPGLRIRVVSSRKRPREVMSSLPLDHVGQGVSQGRMQQVRIRVADVRREAGAVPFVQIQGLGRRGPRCPLQKMQGVLEGSCQERGCRHMPGLRNCRSRVGDAQVEKR